MMSPVFAPPIVGCCLMLAVLFHGDCDWPIRLEPAFGLTYQTRPERFSVTVPLAVVAVGVPPVLLEIVYVNVSDDSAATVTGGVYLNEPSAISVTLPPWVVVIGLPLVIVTPPTGVSLAVTKPVSNTTGVGGVAVVPPVTTASVLLTRLLYVSLPATGLIAMLSSADVPAHPVLSVAVTVKVNVPVA